MSLEADKEELCPVASLYTNMSHSSKYNWIKLTFRDNITKPCQRIACRVFLACLKGFEPLAYGLEVRCSIQLSYRHIVLYIISGSPVVNTGPAAKINWSG